MTVTERTDVFLQSVAGRAASWEEDARLFQDAIEIITLLQMALAEREAELKACGPVLERYQAMLEGKA